MTGGGSRSRKRNNSTCYRTWNEQCRAHPFLPNRTSGEGPSVTPPIVALNPEGARHALTPPSTPQPQVFSQDVTPASSQESQNPFVLDHNSGSFLLPSDMNDPASTLLSQIFAPGTFSNIHGSWTADHNLDFGHGHDFGANLEYAPLWDEHGRSFNADMNANVGVMSVLNLGHELTPRNH